ncbi:MAG TPA: ADP-glyceromanno-heptose 6-epimerase [Steroidobacteraceae bacterium]|nr:ADP-glyceromanno-heptose 6-epimerase [Steroidobacteraceae bacterium]
MYVVTGGAGFIGSNLVASLAARGEEVVVCDWLGRDERWRNLAKHAVRDVIAPESLMPWLARNGDAIEAVLHFGAVSSTHETDVDLLIARNVRPSIDLLEWCAASGVRLIYASSAATYGDGEAGFEDVCSESALAKLRPRNAYGWSKHLVDRRIARDLERGARLPPQWVGLKLFNVYGPNEYHKGSMRSLIAKSCASLARGEPLALFRSYRADCADGAQRRDFIFVDDCIDVVLWLLAHPTVSGLFNVGSGAARSWLELAEALFDALEREPQIRFIDMPAELIEHYQYFTEAPIARLRAAGYDRPFTPLESGVSQYVRQFLTRSDPYR